MERTRININWKKVTITLGIIWGIIILGVVSFYIYTIGKVKINVDYAPFAARVQLNGTTVMNHHDNYITPGEYQVKVEFNNFETYEDTVTIEQDTEFIFGMLSPANEEGEKYMVNHAEEFDSINKYYSIMMNKEGEKLSKKYPIINKLPIKEPYYTIGYTVNDDGIDVTVESSIAYRQLAVSKVLSVLEPDDFGKYGITFYNLDNPFKDTFSANTESDPAEFIKKGFSNAGVDFSVGGGTRSDDYYYAYLRYSFKKGINAVFRIVLIKNGDTWKLAGTPYTLLTTKNTPDVPLEIINKVNQL